MFGDYGYWTTGEDRFNLMKQEEDVHHFIISVHVFVLHSPYLL